MAVCEACGNEYDQSFEVATPARLRRALGDCVTTSPSERDLDADD